MGDAGKGTEDYILQRFSKSTDIFPISYLVAGHHGSDNKANTKEWALATLPKVVSFSAGYRENYGHPRCSTRYNYANTGNAWVTYHPFTCWLGQKSPETQPTSLGFYNTYDSDSAVIAITDGATWQVWTCPANVVADCSLTYTVKL